MPSHTPSSVTLRTPSSHRSSSSLRTPQSRSASGPNLQGAQTTSGTRRLLHHQSSHSANNSHAVARRFQVDRGPVFQDYYNTLSKFFAAKESTSQRANDNFVDRGIPAFLSRLAKSGVRLDTAHISDMLLMSSYLHLPNSVGFELNLNGGSTGLLPLHGRTRFEMVGQHNQRTDFRSLKALPWNTLPGTGYHIWDIRNSDSRFRAAVFRGTNSFVRGRDVKLGADVATGANTNGDPLGIGNNVVQTWLDQRGLLSKYFPKFDFVLGHSLGAALGQDFASLLADRGAKGIYGYFGSAPSLNRPHNNAWQELSPMMYYTQSAQDPVTWGGKWRWPGREMVSPLLDLPVQRGFGNSMFDGLFTQHGAPISIVKSLRGDELHFTTREARPSLDGPFDPESLPLDILGAELADTLRPSVTGQAFTPNPAEKIIADVNALGLEGMFRKDGATGPRGGDYAYFIQLTSSLLASEWVAARYVADPFATLSSIASHRKEILQNPEQGLRALKRSLAEIETNYHPQDDTIKGGRAVMNLLQELRGDLRADEIGAV